jgi:hypothetical protein
MTGNDNYLENAELSTEENANMIDGILNNTPAAPVHAPEDRPLDRVKPPTEKKRSRERER